MLVVSSLLVVFLLIAVTALYVAAEFAAVSVRKTRVQQLADEGNGLAARLLPFINDPVALDRYIAACQVGITVSSLGLGAFGQATIAPPLASLLVELGTDSEVTALSIAAVLVLIVLTTAQMVLGELLPKAIALRFPARVAMYTAVPMAWSLRLFSALIVLLNGCGLFLLRLLRIKHAGSRHVHSPEEIDILLAESRASGALAPEEAQRLHNALHLGKRTAAHLMIPREQIVAMSVDATPEDVLRLASECPYTRLPVYRGTLDRVVGILHTKDVVLSQIAHNQLPSVRRLMRPVVTAPATTPADDLLGMFRERRSQQALVTDEQGKVVGLVTLEDALTQLFGELTDEFKTRQRSQRRAGRRAQKRQEPAP